jgi:peptide/nickel transport system permease protein
LRVFYRFVRNRAAILGCVIVALLIVAAALAPMVAPYDPLSQDLTSRLKPPSAQHLFGTDQFGRDVLSRLLYGAQVSVMTGVVAVSVAMLLGIGVGLSAGFYGGRADLVLMRIVDALLAFPALLLALAMLTMLGSGLFNVILAIGISTSPRFARVVRTSVLSVRSTDYVSSARSMGAGDLRIMGLHVLPNVVSPIIVLASLRVASAILTEANLSFLGLGVSAPTPTWGNMIAEGRLFIYSAPWTALVPGLAITLAVLGFNVMGDGVRDALDPRDRGASKADH